MHARPLRTSRPLIRVTGAGALLLVASACASAQPAPRSEKPRPLGAATRRALDILKTDNAWTLEQQISICEIPAPPFKEAARAAELKRRFVELGLADARIDDEGNVIAERRGSGTGPGVVISGHLDTVFPEGTDVRVRREGTILRAPGIGDDCRGLAVMLAVARAFRDARVTHRGTLYFVGTVGEEGPGNLRGVRHLFEKSLRDRINAFISVDGVGLDLTSGAVGSHRYSVRFRGPGGHSYGDFGMPNPAHALGRAVALVADLEVPSSPKTTFSVSVLRGGTSVNSIPVEAAMDVDLRSESASALDSVDRRFRAALDSAVALERRRWPASSSPLAVVIDTIGIRPAGTQPATSPIIHAAFTAASRLGFTPKAGASSTDANLPISLGIPAITIDGGGRGGGAHSPDEYYDDGADGFKGPQWAALLVLDLLERAGI